MQVAQAVCNSSEPALVPFTVCCQDLARAAISGCLLESGGITRPKHGVSGFKMPPPGAESIGELHASMCQVTESGAFPHILKTA